MIGHIKMPGSKYWRALLLAFLFSPLAVLADQVRIAIGMDYTNAIHLLAQHGGKDISAGQEVFGPKGEWPLNGLYWWLPAYDAIVNLSATTGKITQMTFWSNADFGENKVHRAKTEQKISAITLDTKSKKVAIAKLSPTPPRQPSRTANTGGQNPPGKAHSVKTTFVDDGELTAQEVGEVVSLARECGINEPGEVETFNWLPAGGKGVSVKSVERFKGADITYDEITIAKTGWSEIGVGGKSKRVGAFWADPSDKFSAHLRLYAFRGDQIRVGIGDGITVELADQVISALAARKFRFPAESSFSDYMRQKMLEMTGRIPIAFSKWVDGTLLIHVEGTRHVLQFRFEHGELLLDQVIHIEV